MQQCVYYAEADEPLIKLAGRVAAERGESLSAFIIAALAEKLRRLGKLPVAEEELRCP